MSHVDEGTLHGYLDGELSPAEAQGVEAHLAQCPGCRGRLEEERVLIARAGELLALAAPPDRELPPFRAGDMRPQARLWWKVRLPLAWAATVVLALGIGTYLGSGFARLRTPETAADAAPARQQALAEPAAERARRESVVKPRGAARTPPMAQPAAPAPAAADRAEDVGRQQNAQVAAQPGIGSLDGSPISAETARVLLGQDPVGVPGAPIRAMYRVPEIGYAVVVVEQTLDSSTVIEVVNRRRSPVALGQVVVTGAGAAAPAAQADSVSVPERARLGPARVADSLAALGRYAEPQRVSEKAAARLTPYEAPNRPLRRLGNLEIQISGPLPSDSLQKLLQVVRAVKP
jgi:hypothetical protein